jgi:hypothetical protein
MPEAADGVDLLDFGEAAGSVLSQVGVWSPQY